VRLALLGVRGSTPAPGHPFATTGGNTPCVAVSHDGARPSLILDAGTGLRRLSAQWQGGPFRGTILLTHLHWDHVQGLPFFAAGDRDDADVSLIMPEQGDPVAVLGRALSPPHFPIGPEGLRGTWGFRGLEPGRHYLEDFEVLALDIAHKGGRTYGYRIEDGRASVAYLPDHALVDRAGGPPIGDPSAVANALELVSGVDVLIHDAQFVDAERHVAVAYGHATVEATLALAERAGVGRVILFHHGPDRTDDQLAALLAQVAATASVPVEIGTESSVVDLPEGRRRCPAG
jgi:ribonuclease BN (tRNA processing enzyme)